MKIFKVPNTRTRLEIMFKTHTRPTLVKTLLKTLLQAPYIFFLKGTLYFNCVCDSRVNLVRKTTVL